MFRTRCLLAIALTAAISACATARPPAVTNERELATADEKVLEGCYDCLLEAHAIYARFADAKAGPSLVQRLFETELLLAVREKELALAWQPSIDRARATAARVLPAVQPQRLLAIVEAILPDIDGVPPKKRVPSPVQRQAIIDRLPADLNWLDTAAIAAPVRQYIGLALDCSYADRPMVSGQPGINPRWWDPEQDAPPLVLYRIGICPRQEAKALERTRLAAFHFIEVAYYLGKIARGGASETGGDEANLLFAEAYKRFPKAPGLTYNFGWLHYDLDDCAEAVRFFDETLAIEPQHEGAILARTICLTNLKRNAEAIEGATRLLTLGSTVDSLAYYWRAVNRLVRQELDMARSDIETARKMGETPQVLTMAGVIEHDQDDLDAAERDLRSARRQLGGGTNCTAAFYLARVIAKRNLSLDAAAGFDQAMACYDRRAKMHEVKLAEVRANILLKPEFKARRISHIEASITEARSSYFAAAFNSANHNARGGNFARAREQLDIAAQDPSLANEVARLREAIKG